MTSVAVVAHAEKSLGGGLSELRQLLADEGVIAPLWYEVRKSKRAPARVKQAVCGYGRADKHQVQRMVKTILGLPTVPTPNHAADALAVAICHALSPPLLRLAG